jgi:hypothetical protein
MKSLAVEDQLLLESSRVEITPDGAKRVAEIIDRRPDWDYVLEASIRHAVAPLVKRGLDQVASLENVEGKVPQPIAHDLQALYDGNARRNARLFAALKDVTRGLRAAGAEPVGLKDVQLAVDVYPEPGLRPMGDVDLLIRREDWDTAAHALGSMGFEPLPSADVPFTRKYAMAQHFRRSSDEIWIDLQWNVMQREWDLYGQGSFTYDSRAMWRDAAPIRGLDFELRAPAHEDMLFHLCLHLEGHGYCELVLFCDIAELVRHEAGQLNWDRVVDLARHYGAESSIYYVLLFVEKLLGAPVPPPVLLELDSSVLRGNLFIPLFGNLTSLHLSLDEMRLAAAPPRDVLDAAEVVARRQAARAMALDAELRALAQTFLDRGGSLAVFDGSASLRLFPDPSLRPFEPLRLLVPADEMSTLEQALDERGFGAEASKTIQLSAQDPVLAGCPGELTIEAVWSHDLGDLLGRAAGAETNASSAIRSLRQRLTRPAPSDRSVTVRLDLLALEPEPLVAALAARVGRAKEDRLFRACSLVEALRKLPAVPDWQWVAELARRHGVEQEVAAGLAVAGALTDVPAGGEAAAHVLEWARYGPDSVSRYPWLRAAYYFGLSLVNAKGLGGKFAYFGRALVGGNGGRAVLPRIILKAGRGAAESLRRAPVSLRDFAYWVEPATAERLETKPTHATSSDAP